MASLRRRPARAQKVEPAGRSGWKVAAALAGLIATGPLATWVGATLLTRRAEHAAATLQMAVAPRLAAERSHAAAHATLGGAVTRPGVGATLEALARTLPAGATLTEAGRDARGRLALEVSASDPDALRTALRRSGTFATLRDVAERQGDGAMTITLREGTP